MKRTPNQDASDRAKQELFTNCSMGEVRSGCDAQHVGSLWGDKKPFDTAPR